MAAAAATLMSTSVSRWMIVSTGSAGWLAAVLRAWWQLAWALHIFLSRRGHWHDWAATEQAAVAAAERLADPTVQARARRRLALAHIALGRLDDADTQLRHSLDLCTRASDLVEQAHTHFDLGYLWERRGRLAEALDYNRRALDLFRAAGNRRGQARALSGVGWDHALTGDHQLALTYCKQALTLLQELDDRPGHRIDLAVCCAAIANLVQSPFVLETQAIAARCARCPIRAAI